jgi:hypothetical protein
METKVAVRPEEANLLVGGAASKVWLARGELYLETGDFTASTTCTAFCPVANTVNVAVINKSYNVIIRHPAVIFQHHGIHNRR